MVAFPFKILPPKNESFEMKKSDIHISAQNLDLDEAVRTRTHNL